MLSQATVCIPSASVSSKMSQPQLIYSSRCPPRLFPRPVGDEPTSTPTHLIKLAQLEHLTYQVGLYLWLGISGILSVPTIANVVLKLQGLRRRREAGYRTGVKRLPRVQSIDPVEHHISPGYFWYWPSAFWRGYSIKHSGVSTPSLPRPPSSSSSPSPLSLAPA